MGLGLPTGGGSADFVQYVKYNAKAGRWYCKNDDGEAEVKQLTAIFDLAQIKTGNFKYAAGVAPDYRFDSSVGACDAASDEGYKRGFYVLMYSPKTLGGVREFSSNAGTVNEAMNDLYSAFEAAPEAKAGKCPVVTCEDVQPVENKHGTNYRPVFKIVKWVDRPDDLPMQKATVATQGSPSPAKAPAEAAVPPAADDDDEF